MIKHMELNTSIRIEEIIRMSQIRLNYLFALKFALFHSLFEEITYY
jgi:hypothetical protein